MQQAKEVHQEKKMSTDQLKTATKYFTINEPQDKCNINETVASLSQNRQCNHKRKGKEADSV